jgi:hypothetical protein
MGASNNNLSIYEFELIRKIKYSTGDVSDWGPSYCVDSQTVAVKQIWSDLERLSTMHLDLTSPFKMTFEAGDNPTASFTFFNDTDENNANTISWRIEKRIKSDD